jgi:hypothetical protein
MEVADCSAIVMAILHTEREHHMLAVPGDAYETLHCSTAFCCQVDGYGTGAASAPRTSLESFLAFLEPYLIVLRISGITTPHAGAAAAPVRRLAMDFYLSRLRALQHAFALCALLLIAPLTLTGCTIVEDIFKAGVWVGVLLAIGVIVLIVWLVSKSMG